MNPEETRELFYSGALYIRNLDDGRIIVVYPQLYTYIVVVGPQKSGGYDDSFEYASMADALFAAQLWDGNGDAPEGWHRNPKTGRRRPEGDPAREYIRW